jgi:ParB family transcriptional regulator, chromosome partitioning protein
MNARTRGLGRGLGALLPSAPVRPTDGDRVEPTVTTPPDVWTLPPIPTPTPAPETLGPGSATQSEPGAYFEEIALDAIVPNPRQPRRTFDDDALAELVHSIREVGLLQPIVVRSVSPSRYELVVGERRWRAAREAGLGRIPAIVRNTSDDAMLRDALLENLHREQLNPLEEAAAYDQLLQDFGATHEQLADRIGRSRSQVTNTIRLLRLPAPVQRRVAAGVLSAGHARALLAIPDPDRQEALATRIVAEGLSVRAVEEMVAVGDLDAGSERRPRSTPLRATAPGLDDLAGKLSDRFETRVKVELGRRKGKIIIEFASLDDLERIVETMAPGTARARDPERGSDGGSVPDGERDFALAD